MCDGEGRQSVRAQSEVLGVVLLIALVATVGVGTLLAGASVIDDGKGAIQFENADNTMREVDARLSRVAFSDNKVETLELSRQQNVTVYNESYMNVTVNEHSACKATIRMGSIRSRTDSDRAVAYEGGGVWKRTEAGTTLVSPPDFQYQNGTINFPLVNVNGTIRSGGKLTATKNVTRSRKRSRQITKELTGDPICRPVNNVTINVTSDFYEAWGRYFEDVTPVSTVDTDDANRTAKFTLALKGSPTPASIGGSGVSVGSDFIAEANVLGTEGTVREDWSSVPGDGAWGDGEEHYAELNDPYSLRVRINDTNVYTPWRDKPDGTFADAEWTDSTEFPSDNINTPWRGPPQNIKFRLDANTKFALEAAIHNCDVNSYGPNGNYTPASWENTSAEPERYDKDGDGDVDEVYHQYRCERIDRKPDKVEKYTQVQTDASKTASGDPNIIVLADGDRADLNFEDKTYQKNLEQLLGSRFIGIDTDADGDYEEFEANLNDNQVIFIYELSSPQSFPRGGEDYNDAVIVVSFYEEGNAAGAGSIRIKITASQIEIQSA